MSNSKDWIKKLPVEFVVEIGRDRKTIEEIRNWRKGVTVQLDHSESNKLNVYLNNKLYGVGLVLRKQTGEMDLKIVEKKLSEEEILKCLDES